MKMTPNKAVIAGGLAWVAGIAVPGLGMIGLGLALGGMALIAAGSVMEGRLS